MDARALKIEAARVALEEVEPGMRLGIGTGSTAEEFIRLLGARVSDGLAVVGVPTSERSAALCRVKGSTVHCQKPQFRKHGFIC